MKVINQNICSTDLAWAAGLIDGEGWVGIIKTHKKQRLGLTMYIPTLSVGMTNERALKNLQRIFGVGTISTYQQLKLIHKRAFQWRVGGYTSAQILKKIQPYLIIKKDQARFLLEFIYRKHKCTGSKVHQAEQTHREFFYHLLKAINRRGNYYV